MATSSIQICSNALLLLGQPTISSFDEDQTGLSANFWDPVRQATLRMAPWSCARKRVSLAPLATAPAFDWSYEFQLPSDCVRVISIGERGQFYDHEIEDGKILTDISEVKLRYVFDNGSPSSWDSMLSLAVTWHMAWVMAYPITGSKEKQEQMANGLTALLKIARGVNHTESPGETIGDNPLLNARRGAR